MSSSFNNFEPSLNNEDDWSSEEENNSPDEIKPINELSRYSKEFKELEPLGSGASGKVYYYYYYYYYFLQNSIKYISIADFFLLFTHDFYKPLFLFIYLFIYLFLFFVVVVD